MNFYGAHMHKSVFWLLPEAQMLTEQIPIDY